MNVASPALAELSQRPAFPLSVAQTYMWLGHTVSPDQSWYNVGGYIEICGPIDPSRMVEAVRRNVSEIECLNTVFLETADGPEQCVLPDMACPVPIVDLSESTDPRASAHVWMQADINRPFDLARGPLQRNALLRLAPDLWIYYGARHHLITDAFTGMQSARRVAAIYTWLAAGGERPPAPLTSVLDLLDEDEAYRVSGQEARDRRFWHTELTGRPEPSTLSGRAPVRGGKQIHASLFVPRADAEAMTRLGLAHRASFAAVIMAATATYLSRLTGARDLILGVPVANRPSPKLRRIMGATANVVPLRVQVDPATPFAALVSDIARRMRAALRHQRYPAGALRRDQGLSPDQPDIYGTLVNVLALGESFDFAGATGRGFHLRNGRADDLLIAAMPADDGRPLEIAFSANAANYTADALARHVAGFEQLLKDMLAAPDTPVGRLKLVSDEGASRLLQEQTRSAPATTLLALFEGQAARRPDAVALIWGEERVSYGALNAGSAQLARQLQREGVDPTNLIGLCIGREPATMLGLLAIMKAGCAYMPLDLAMPAARLEQILGDARPVLVLGAANDAARLPRGVPFLTLPPWEDSQAMRIGADWQSPLMPSDPAYLIFTSGSSGLPKGVMVSHQGIAALAASHVARFEVTQDSRVLQFASLAFDASVAELATAWGSGGALVLVAPDALSGPPLERRIEAAQVTHATLPPAVLATLTPRPGPLECLAVAGDACTPALAASWSGLTRMINAYGPTETTVCVTLSEDFDGNGVPAGRTIGGSRVYVLDAALQLVPDGIEGEIYIAGDSLACGYLNRPGETATRFVADPFGPPGGRMYRSGDRGCWRPDGQLEFLGRRDRQVKIRGMRVEPAEIEVVLRSLREVADAVVIAREDRPGDVSLAAYLVPAPGGTIDASLLRSSLAARLPAHMLPSAYVVMTALPLTPNGKLDRRALPAPAREALAVAPHEPPSGERESHIVAIWQDLLYVTAVGRHDNFFALGGHSLLLIALATRLRQRGWTANFALLFNDLTPASLAAALTDSVASEDHGDGVTSAVIAPGAAVITPDMVPLARLDQISIDRVVAAVPGGAGNVQDIYPLSPLQEGILFHHRTAAGRDAYVLSALLAVAGDERLELFVEALRAVIRRHDSLRTSFVWDGLDEPVQVVWHTATLSVENLGRTQGDVREVLWNEVEAGGHIDLRQAPLLRVRRAWDAPRSEWCVLLHFHHAVTDHVTLERIVAEVRASLVGELLESAPVAPYRGAVMLARRTMSDQAHDVFFRSRLGDIDAPTAPFDVRDLDGAAVEEARLVIGPALAGALRDRASCASVSCAALFHAAWALVLACITGRRDVVFGTVLSGRLQGSTTAATALGLVINTLPLRLSLNGLTVAEALREVQACLAALLVHEQASLALAQGCSAVVPPTPLFTTLLNYRHSEAWAEAAPSGVLPSWGGVQVLRTQERSHYPFTLTVEDFGAGFELLSQAPRQIGAARMATTMEAALTALSQALSEAPGAMWDHVTSGLAARGHKEPDRTPWMIGGQRQTTVDAEAAREPTGGNQSSVAPDGRPLSPTLELLASIWCSVLCVPHVVPTDDFFALGGHSLAALRVITQLRERLGLDLPLKTLFACRTLETLAQRIDGNMQDDLAASTTLPLMRPCAQDGPAPLSRSQERMWLIQSLAPDSTAYNMAAGLMLTGPVDVALLCEAVARVCGRQDVLRSVIRTVDGLPMQQVAFETGTTLQVIDLRDRGAEAEQAAHALAEQQVRMPFDLEQDRPFRASLFQIEDERFLLALVLHHVMADHWSFGILGRELAVFYNAAMRGRAPLLQALRINYRDFAVWQRSSTIGSGYAQQMNYWRTQLADLPTLDLPTDRPYPAMPSYQGAVCVVPIPPALAARIAALERETGATLFMVMLGALAALLYRLTGQTDIPIAVPVANRTQSATEALVGTFVNTVVVRADVSGNPRFDWLVRRIRATSLDAFAHAEVPFDALVQDIVQRRDANRAPLAQIMFNVTNTPMQGIAFEALDWQPVILDRGGAQFDLSVTVDPEVSRVVSFEYSVEIFDRTTIERLATAYVTLLEAACGNAGTPINHLALLPEADRAHLQAWNDTARPLPYGTTYATLFHAQAERSPEALAVSCQGERLTYAELDARSNALARHLRALGAAPGALVALCVPRTLALPVALLGVLKSGAAYVPLDPDYPPERLTFMLADSGARVLLTADGCGDGIDCPENLRVVDLVGIGFDGAAEPVDETAPAATQQDAAYVIYTSGSTGRPKGVVVPHGALVNFLLSMERRPGLMKTDILACVTTISFDIAALEIFLPLMVGAAVELVPRAIAADGVALAGVLAASGATVMQATPATWRLLLEAGWRGGPGFRAFCGGETLPRDLADALLDCAAELWNLYGPTETTIWSSLDRVSRGDAITIGRPIANTQIHILDEEGETVPIGFAGEICIGGAGVALGYLNRPELTAERFVPDAPDAELDARLYRTGDLGLWREDGRLLHLGRRDQQVKLRGFRVEPGEVESAISAHPAVRQAVVVAREAQPGDTRLVAYVVYRDGEDLTASDVRRHLRRSLPDFMIPSVVMALPALPLTPNGKIDRRALPDPFQAPRRAVARGEPPSPGLEQAVAGIWCSVLGLDEVFAEDNFFEIGGHSLLALRVSVALRQQTGLLLDPRAMFFHSLRQLAGMATVGSPGDNAPR